MNETNSPQLRDVMINGVFTNNVTFVQILGLCPLMAITTTATNGLGLGLMTAMVLACSNFIVSALRKITPNQIRIPVYISIIASLVTILDLTMNAWMHDLHKVMGLFIPLIIANCAVLGRAEAFAAHNKIFPAALDGLATGLGFTLGLTSVGAVREILGSGTLFSGFFIAWRPFQIYGNASTARLPGFFADAAAAGRVRGHGHVAQRNPLGETFNPSRQRTGAGA
jgi:electron transport complex protein RnfE